MSEWSKDLSAQIDDTVSKHKAGKKRPGRQTPEKLRELQPRYAKLMRKDAREVAKLLEAKGKEPPRVPAYSSFAPSLECWVLGIMQVKHSIGPSKRAGGPGDKKRVKKVGIGLFANGELSYIEDQDDEKMDEILYPQAGLKNGGITDELLAPLQDLQDEGLLAEWRSQLMHLAESTLTGQPYKPRVVTAGSYAIKGPVEVHGWGNLSIFGPPPHETKGNGDRIDAAAATIASMLRRNGLS